MTSNIPQSNLCHGCIVMASGMGKRFGGNKLMANLGGRPLAGYAIDLASQLFNQCVVVTRHKSVADYCLRHCAEHGVRVVLHDQPKRSDTVRLGMEALEGCDTVTFLQGDQPLVSLESVERLLRAAEGDPDSIWRVCFEGVPGAPMLFPSWCFPELACLPEGKGGGFLAKKYPERVRVVPVRDEIELFDVDTQEDLQRLRSFLSESADSANR